LADNEILSDLIASAYIVVGPAPAGYLLIALRLRLWP
jgi:hypothetical protein